MPNNLSEELSKIDVLLNRLLLQKSALEYKQKKQKDNQRKARTRTLIQLGGLIEITPLLSICNIELGNDLQIEYPDKAATLLGIIVNSVNQLPENLCNDDLMKFQNTGVKFLKQRSKNVRNIVHV